MFQNNIGATAYSLLSYYTNFDKHKMVKMDELGALYLLQTLGVSFESNIKG